MFESLQPHELQHARPPCPSPTPGVHSNSCPSSRWCHPAISSSVVPFSFCPQSLPASQSLPMSQLFAWGGQSTGVSALASFLPKKSQGWSRYHWLDGRESEWTLGVGDGQGGLACCDSWGPKESNMTERLNWTEYLEMPIIAVCKFLQSSHHCSLSHFQMKLVCNRLWLQMSTWCFVI